MGFVVAVVKLGFILIFSWLYMLGCVYIGLMLVIESLQESFGVTVGIFLGVCFLVGYLCRCFILFSWRNLGEVGFGLL